LDTDSAFGSIGSFFSFRPSRGVFEANPPFEISLILAMLAHMDKLLHSANQNGEALSFIVIVPRKPEAKFWQDLVNLSHCTAELNLHAGEHSFLQGAQHIRHDAINNPRQSSGASTVCFLQSHKGREDLPLTDSKLALLRDAFRPNVSKSRKSFVQLVRQRGGSEGLVRSAKRKR